MGAGWFATQSSPLCPTADWSHANNTFLRLKSQVYGAWEPFFPTFSQEYH